MHAVFIPYGIKQQVDHLLADMQAQKFKFLMHKEGEEDRFVWIQGSLRVLPFGVYEYVFPKEAEGVVLTCLQFHEPVPYNIGKTYLAMLRKALHIKKCGSFDTKETCLWIKEGVSLIPLGIREDRMMLEDKGEMAGWTHEQL